MADKKESKNSDVEKYSQINRYAQALKNLIQESFTGQVIIESPDTAFQYATSQTDGNIQFPLISLHQTPNIQLDSQYNSFAQIHEGAKLEFPMNVFNDNGTIKGETNRIQKNVTFLYILIDYQIDVWGLDRHTVEDTVQELIFWLYINKTVSTKILNEDLEFTFTISPQIIDNSDLTTYMTNGKLYRYTLSIEVQGTLQRTKNFFTLHHPNTNVEELK